MRIGVVIYCENILLKVVIGLENLQNISEANDGLPVYQGNRRIGTVSLSSQEFREGNIMLFGGRYWRIVRLEKSSIHVLPSQRVDAPLMPRWSSGRKMPIGHNIAQRCAEILSGKELPISLSLDDASRTNLERLRANLDGFYDKRLLPYWMTPSTESLTFAGELGNAILALIITESGTHCRPSKGRGFLSLQSDVPLDLHCIPNDLKLIKAIIQKHWRSLSPYANQSSFSIMLPMQIRRDEIVTQLTRREMLEFIAGFHNKKFTRIRLPLFNAVQ